MVNNLTKKGYNMTRGNKGMRKGISLVEMLVAIVLFGIIGTISYTYYKNYYDTSFAAKQLRVYTIVDQAAQLSNAFDLYNTKNGADAVSINDFVTDKILTQVPAAQPFITATGWTLEHNQTVVTGDNTGVVFQYNIDANASSNTDKLDYCNILNNVADKAWTLDKVDADQALLDVRWADGNTSITSEMEFFNCAEDSNATTYSYKLVFIKRATVQ